MDSQVLERRFVCGDCKYVHTTWSARCVGCNSLSGLVMVTSRDVEQLASQMEPDFDEEDQEAEEDPVQEVPKFARPRLSIVRPMTGPELTDSEEELGEPLPQSSSRSPIPISEIDEEATFARDLTGLAPLDHVLGGGLVPASVVFLAAPPGTGKTSLTLQMLVGLRQRALYATGEETEAQVAGTARRIKAVSSRLFVFAERDLHSILTHAKALNVKIVAVDSLQKMVWPDVPGRANTPTQLKECTAQLVKFAKETKISVWLIGHVTGEGDIAGPKTVEHDVDVVLELDRGDKFDGNERILNCYSKNRFGPTNVKGHFQLTPTGLVPVDLDGWDEQL